ncbi:hypothetical protein SARC_11753 [Sphaeroforma arctica JP610]|uniref:Uncharacterized protein n=1 Tax=Sphaeroforma arctica JP610 TaxID=667725 RepID=A0A0L0FG29_9EUKA|nr:hypothetical protein SARC_11753 [Sphaeroforma arctica JP610]KNC75732.1 hypothetical protein SARC_11753 [Sphaeroforma arctica JP610]|eukprot:XP_014149634.1 hypothetical protein SARC_11753 [Sphaeroforma arctica JP610]
MYALCIPTHLPHPQPPQKKNSVDPEGDFEGDPMDVAGHVSNEVLEWEVNNCAKAIAAAKAKGQEPDNDILQKKQTAEVMMQVLIIQIQTEKLSLEDYCAQVKTKIVAEKKLAAKLKAKGKIEWAKAALMRAKIMEKEMEE